MLPVQSASATKFSYSGFVGPMGNEPLAPPAARPSRPLGNDRPGKLPAAAFDGAVKNAMISDPKAQISVDRNTGSATFVRGSFDVKVAPGVGNTKGAVAAAFINEHGTLFGVDNVRDLKLVAVARDAGGVEHARYAQQWQGLPVFGQQVVVHSKGSTVTSAGGRITPNIAFESATPRLTAEQAFLAAQQAAGEGQDAPAKLELNKLGIYTTTDGVPHMAWEMDLAGSRADTKWRYYVDADSGKVLDRWSTVHSFDHAPASGTAGGAPAATTDARAGAASTNFDSGAKRQTYDAQQKQSRPGKLARTNNDAAGTDTNVNLAHDNAGAVWDYFNDNYKRDSLDGRGMTLKSTVHYGSKYNNAFWDGSQMTYGDGDGVRFTAFGDALDVVAHEMAHGVTEKTAGLRYFNQSGALNESWSDVFGNVVEKWDERRKNPTAPERDLKWLVGEQIFTPKTDGDGLRSMSEPGKGYSGDPQPGHMKDYKNTSSDNGGVHINSGIPNKAAYIVGTKLGIDKLGAIWYNTLTNYLTPSSQFIDAANFTTQAAEELYGATSPEVQTVRDAWAEVGIAVTRKPGIN